MVLGFTIDVPLSAVISKKVKTLTII